jgi:hypothetical protein
VRLSRAVAFAQHAVTHRKGIRLPGQSGSEPEHGASIH